MYFYVDETVIYHRDKYSNNEYLYYYFIKIVFYLYVDIVTV